MKRYEIYEVRGRRFALAMTLASEEQICEVFEMDDIDLKDIFGNGKDNKTLTKNTLKAFEILAAEGAAYAQVFEEKEFERPDMDQLKHYLKRADILDMRLAVVNAFTLGWKRDVELEEDESKNAESPED